MVQALPALHDGAMTIDCTHVASYLDSFGKPSANAAEVDGISEHVRDCRACFHRVADFFRLLKAPDTGYLRETIDDLTLAIYNLVKSLLLHTPPETDDDRRENLRFSRDPGEASQYIRDGAEAIDDVEDFLGSDNMQGESMESIRADLVQSHRRLTAKLLQRGVDLGGLYSLDCRNLQGVLHLYAERLDEAERAFSAVVTAAVVDPYIRSVQVCSMLNLAYVYQRKRRFDDAVKWADRAKALACDIGNNPFPQSFGLAYFLLLRNRDGDDSRAAAEVGQILAQADTAIEFRRYLAMPTNTVIKDLFLNRGIAAPSDIAG